MDPFQNQHAPVRRDEFGNPIRSDEYGLRVDEYGNPVRQTTDEYGQFGSAGTFGDAPAPGGTQQHYSTQPHHVGGVHHDRSSSSSSSEEDDGHGGRRKKGLKEKIKEKIPGMGPKHQDQSQATSTITPGAGAGAGAGGTYSTHEPPRQEKGMMEKMKEKLPGHHPTP